MAVGKQFVCHFDGKQVEDYTDGVKSVKERMSVSVSSPDLKNSQILGSMPLDGQTGDDIFQGVMYLLEEFDITDQIVAFSFDTTASNSGPDQGACARLEAALEEAKLWLACRRHIMELHIKHVAKAAAKGSGGRGTTGPSEPLFKQLKDNWGELLPLIDLNSLNKLDWATLSGNHSLHII